METEEKESKSSDNVGFKKILLTAIITALITTISQSFLANRKLKNEQEIWRNRYNIETIDKLNDKRFELIEEVNQGLLQLEIKAKEIKILAAAVKINPNTPDLKHLNDLMIKYHKDLYLNQSKIQMTALFFDKEVKDVIPTLNKTLEMNFNNNLSFIDNKIELAGFDIDFETIDTLSQTRVKLITTMSNEIREAYEFKNEIE